MHTTAWIIATSPFVIALLLGSAIFAECGSERKEPSKTEAWVRLHRSICEAMMADRLKIAPHPDAELDGAVYKWAVYRNGILEQQFVSLAAAWNYCDEFDSQGENK